MGPNVSASIPAYPTGFGGSALDEGYVKMGGSLLTQSAPRSAEPDFAGIWSLRQIGGICPTPRVGHFTVYSQEFDKAVVGYGSASDGSVLNDIWELDFSTHKWTELKIEPAPSPRAGCRAVIVGTLIWVFGGFHNKKYLADLHSIDIKTGHVSYPSTTGDVPLPRSGHSMTYAKGKILIYGGYDGNIIGDVHILDLSSLEWRRYETLHPRCRMSYSVFGHKTVTFGGSSLPGVLVLDPLDGSNELMQCDGPSPWCGLSKASLGVFDRYILVVGGDQKAEAPNKFSAIYALDFDSQIWFLFPILPDGLSVAQSDGEFDNNGVFCLPVCSDCSMVYRPQKREFVIFLGKPYTNPPMESVISVSGALAVLHQHRDILSMLNFK